MKNELCESILIFLYIILFDYTKSLIITLELIFDLIKIYAHILFLNYRKIFFFII